jgi:hypothetical protein
MVLKVMLDNSDEFRWLSVAITKENRRTILDEDDELDDEDSMLDGDIGLSDRFTEGTRS